MKLQIASDIHLEFYAGSLSKALRIIAQIPRLADTLLLAGDILSLRDISEAETLLRAFEGWANILYVPGNHEFYGGSIQKRTHDLHSLPLRIPNLHVLHAGKVLELEGRRFLGDTMWFPDGPNVPLYCDQLNDFRMIQELTPAIYEINFRFESFLERELQEGDVVMTHHLPSYLCVDPAYKEDPTNCFYVSECFDLIADRKPALWIHGHSHTPNDMNVVATRVVSFPKGYPHSTNEAEWRKGRVVEI